MEKVARQSPRRRIPRIKRSLRRGFRIRGRRVWLRPVTTADATPAYCRWLNDPEVNRFTESKYSRATIPALRKYIQSIGRNGGSFFFAIMEMKSDRHVGNIKVDSVITPHWDHLVGEMGLIIGERDCWGRGYATEAIALMTRFCFRKLGLRKVTATCYLVNRASARAFEKAGFKKEAVRRKNARYLGKQVDLVLLGAINPRDGK